MNREILFRAKRLDTGTWVESGIAFSVAAEDDDEERGFVAVGFDYNGMNEPYNFYTLEVDPATIGQFTGMTDKNSKKIFEGDVVRFEDYCCVEKITTIAMGFVFFYDAEFGIEQISGIDKGWMNSFYGPDGKEFLWNELEIIGNIHDNPELTK